MLPVVDARPLKTAAWRSKSCDVCGASSVRPLGVRECVWPTRHARYQMQLHDARCEACGFVFEAKIPDADFLKQYYTDSFSLESDRVEIEPSYDAQKRLAFLRRFVPDGGRILEIGANRGDFCVFLQKHGYAATGIDPLEGDREGVRSAFVTGGLEAGDHDAVVSYYVLEHIAEPRAWIEAALASLKPGGTIVIEVPNFERHPSASLNHEHLLHFTPHHLTRLLESLGCRVSGVDTEAPSRYFGFVVAAQKGAGSGVPVPAPDTERIYRDALHEKRAQADREAQVASDVLAFVGASGPLGRAGRVPVYFWGANEIATAIAVNLAERGGERVDARIVDNSTQKRGRMHEGFLHPIAAPDARNFGPDRNVFVLCSPSWNDAIRRQIDDMRLQEPVIVDVRERGIGVPQR